MKVKENVKEISSITLRKLAAAISSGIKIVFWKKKRVLV